MTTHDAHRLTEYWLTHPHHTLQKAAKHLELPLREVRAQAQAQGQTLLYQRARRAGKALHYNERYNRTSRTIAAITYGCIWHFDGSDYLTHIDADSQPRIITAYVLVDNATGYTAAHLCDRALGTTAAQAYAILEQQMPRTTTKRPRILILDTRPENDDVKPTNHQTLRTGEMRYIALAERTHHIIKWMHLLPANPSEWRSFRDAELALKAAANTINNRGKEAHNGSTAYRRLSPVNAYKTCQRITDPTYLLPALRKLGTTATVQAHTLDYRGMRITTPDDPDANAFLINHNRTPPKRRAPQHCATRLAPGFYLNS